MDCCTYFTHVQTCNVTRVQSATECILWYILYTCPNLQQQTTFEASLRHPWSSLRAMKASSPLQAPFKHPSRWSPLQAPFKLPSSPLQAPLKPPWRWSPLQAPSKPPSTLKAWSPLQAPLKPLSSPLEAPFKVKPPSSSLEAPLKPLWSPLKAFRRWSPLRPSDLRPPPPASPPPTEAVSYFWWFELFELLLSLICNSCSESISIDLSFLSFWADPAYYITFRKAWSSKLKVKASGRNTFYFSLQCLVSSRPGCECSGHQRISWEFVSSREQAGLCTEVGEEAKSSFVKVSWKHRPVHGPPQCVPCSLTSLCPVGLGKNFWLGIAAAVLLRVMEFGWNWCEDSSANCVESSCSMVHGGGNRGSFFEAIFGFGFCFPSFLSVLTLTPKSDPKLKPFLASDFSLLGWSLGTLCDAQWDQYFCWDVIFNSCLRIQASRIDWTSASQLNHRQASIRMLLRCSKDTGGVLELVRNFKDVLRSWLWRRNLVQWLRSYECIGCQHLFFWQFVREALGT